MLSQNMMDNSLLMEDNSYDKEDKTLKKIMKKYQGNIRKTNPKLRVNNGVQGNKKHSNKFTVFKRPESTNKNMHMAYEHMNYIEDLNKMHNNIEDMMFNKSNMKFEQKRKKVSGGKKSRKGKRSATPGLTAPPQYLGH